MLTSADLASVNMGEVLSHLHKHGPQTRANLAGQLGLSRSASGDMLDGLSALELVSIGGTRPTGRVGRPSAQITVGTTGPVCVCLEFRSDREAAGHDVHCAAVGLGGTLLLHDVRRIEPTAPESICVGQLVQSIRSRLPRSSYLAGITVTGREPLYSGDRHGCCGRKSGNQALPIAVRSRVELAAWGELTHGAAVGLDSVLVLESRRPFAFHLLQRSGPAGVTGTAAPLMRAVSRPYEAGGTVRPGRAADWSGGALAHLLREMLQPELIILDTELGDHACGLGAAELFFSPWFNDPVRAESQYRPAR